MQGGLSQQTGVIIQPQQIVLTQNKVQQNTQVRSLWQWLFLLHHIIITAVYLVYFVYERCIIFFFVRLQLTSVKHQYLIKTF